MSVNALRARINANPALARLFGKHATRSDKGRSRYALADVKAVLAVQHRVPARHAHQVPTDMAIDIARDAGLVKGEITVDAVRRIARAKGLNLRGQLYIRIRAETPQEVHQLDFSVSEYLRLDEELPGGDWTVRISKNPDRPYKNKYLKDRERLWMVAVVDDHSSALWASYIVTRGEDTDSALECLQEVWRERKEGEDIVGPYGIPLALKTDTVGWARSEAIQNFLISCGVNWMPTKPYSPWAKGKVETAFRRIWERFELRLVLTRGGETVKLSEIARLLVDFIDDWNRRAHPSEKGVSRMDAWLRVFQHGGVCTLENLERFAFKTFERVVNAYGEISLHGTLWRIRHASNELYRQKVRVLAARDGRITVEDKFGRKYTVTKTDAVPYGTYRSHGKSAADKVAEEVGMIKFPSKRNVKAGGTGAGGALISMRPRETKREPDDPLAADDILTFEEACMMLGEMLGGVLSDEVKDTLREKLDSLRRDDVAVFGHELMEQLKDA